MTVTATTLKIGDSDISCVYAVVESGVGYIYYGSDDGDVYRYAITAATLTRIGNVGGRVIGMTMYGGVLYLSLAGGVLASMTTS